MAIFNFRNPIEYPLGLMELIASMGSGAAGQIAGLPAGLLKAVQSGQFGTQEGVKTAQDEANRVAGAMTYQPRTQTAADIGGLIGKAMEASKLPPVMPELQALGAMSAMPKQAYLAQGMNIEKALEPVVAKTMSQGGLPAGLLSDLAQGSRRQIFVPATPEEAFKASKMLKTNTPQEVWQKTGIGRGPDGEWRKEISDKAAKYDPEALADLKARDDFDYMKHTQPFDTVLEHKKLFEFDPELANIHVGFMPEEKMKGAYGAYSPKHNRISLLDSLTDEKARSSSIHEVTHPIQEKYGFAVGGNARDFAKIKQDANDRITQLNAKMSEVVRKKDNPSISKQEKDALQAQYYDLMDERSSLVPMAQIDPVDAYLNLMGEAEARLAQRRIDLSDAQRRENYPFEYTGNTGYGLDVPVEGLIHMTKEGDIINTGILGNIPSNMLSLKKGAAAQSVPVFETGKEVSFPYIKNTEKAPKLVGFGQDVEPAGNYISSGHDVDMTKLPSSYASGKMSFKNPLVLDWGEGLYSDPDNWKNVLSKKYGGKTGKALSKAIAKDGYDGIVTTNKYGPSEIVDLSMFHAKGLLGEIKSSKSLPDTSYRMTHTAPNREFGATLDDLTGGGQMYPADVYSPKGYQYYGAGMSYDKKAFDIANKFKGKPDATVEIYRAVPKGVSDEINAGDWVTLTKEYAQEHGQGPLKGDYKIIKKKVKASDIYTNADSIHEWGYDPK